MNSSTNQTYSEATVLLWLRRNRGLLARIRAELKGKYSYEFVRLVCWGRNRNPEIEARLRSRGWRRNWFASKKMTAMRRAA